MFLFLTSKIIIIIIIIIIILLIILSFFFPRLLLYDFFSAVVAVQVPDVFYQIAKPPAHPSPSKKRVRPCKPCATDYFLIQSRLRVGFSIKL